MTRVALIGLGMAVTPHAKSLIDLGADVALAYAPSAARRAQFATKFPFPTTDDLGAILSDPNITAVGILTPPNTHLELVEQVAAAGKHILLEKPLDVSTTRAKAVVEAGKKAGVTIAVMLQHRFKPAAEKLSEILASGRLGKIVSCSTRIPWWRPQSYYDEPGRGTLARDGGGVLITQGIHVLDLMLSLAGPVAEVCGFTATTALHQMETEDYAASAVRYQNGALGVIEATTAFYPGAAERIEFIGTKGTAVLSGYGYSLQLMDGTSEVFEPPIATMGATTGGTADPMAFPHDLHQAAWADFFGAIATGRPPRVSAEEALKVHHLIDAMLDAGKSDKKVRVANSE
ncbi:putative dehydrogenase [Rhizomicrobium palustre]|uniref:Putative dehydrogenase n=1 Tax=Rhizomicrobium palustre TaxID=189966 RepID=A0A846MYT0_9PROT|nr:Gfo/Idh/MocA family oxidoreductase [Rhizomicrobium palustre]NIK88463.1 putative dehydrogenase [Rhizomicrobium palustre]